MEPKPRLILPQGILDEIRRRGGGEAEAKDEPRPPSKPHLSFTQLGMWLRCRRQYYFRYILGLKEKPKVSLAIGRGGHSALEKNTKRKLVSGVDSPVEEVVQWASDFMDHELAQVPPSETEKDADPGETKDKFLAATKVFQTRDAPKIKPIGAEIGFSLDVNDLAPELNLPEPIRIVEGKIDLLQDDPSSFVTHHEGQVRMGVDDYKFVTRAKNQSAVDLSPQLTTYAAVVKKLTGKWPTRLGFIQLHPGTKQNPPDAIHLARDPELTTPEALSRRMRRLILQLRSMEIGIRNEDWTPVDDPITCSWCGFRDRCQMTLVDDFEAAILRANTAPPS